MMMKNASERALRIERPAEGMEFSYDIVWEDSFECLPALTEETQQSIGKICVVTDDTVAGFYLQEVTERLQKAASVVVSYVIPAGEENKHLGTVQGLYAFLIENHFERKDLLVALGGGVVGDLTGFTAATYLRGVPFIQIPTTLLADVDSSVGGKTGVDFDAVKNMVGAFYQPRLVYMNASVLKTLPAEQFASGMAEVIKSALICDASFFDWLEVHKDEILRREASAINEMIRNCCRIKAAVVAQDPKETGLRAILNYGHTIGHAVEKLSDFTLLHGCSVAIGMMAALSISVKRGAISFGEFERIRSLLQTFSLPITTPHMAAISVESVLDALHSDKKMEHGAIRFILLEQIGTAVIDHTLTDDDLREAICTIL